jgi:hypothetical protein
MEVIDDYLQKCEEIVQTIRGQKKEIRKGCRIVCKNYFSRKDGACIWNGT